MYLLLDADVAKVAQFMVENLPADRLCIVAQGLNQIAPLVWSCEPEKQPVMSLHMDPILPALVIGVDSVDDKSPSDCAGSALPS